MARHEKDIRIKWLFQLLIYFIVVVVMIGLFFVVKYLKEKPANPQKSSTSIVDPRAPVTFSDTNNSR